MAVLIGLVLTAGSIQTLLKEAISFTYCQLKKVKTLLHKGISFTFMIQLYIIAIVAAALAPLYFQQMKQTGAGYIWIVLAFVIVKAWNLFVAWKSHFNRSKYTKG